MAAWLDDEEMKAWRGFMEVHLALSTRLEEDLREHGISAGDYEVLVHLSDSPRRSLRMCDLATRLGLSPSGLTRRLDGLVKLGYVARVPSEDDRRVTLAHLTPKGFRALEKAAPDHVAGVRRHFLDHLSARQVRELGAAMEAVRAGLDGCGQPVHG